MYGEKISKEITRALAQAAFATVEIRKIPAGVKSDSLEGQKLMFSVSSAARRSEITRKEVA